MSKFNDTYTKLTLELLEQKYDKSVIIEHFIYSDYDNFDVYTHKILINEISLPFAKKPITTVDQYLQHLEKLPYEQLKTEHDAITDPKNKQKVMSNDYIRKDPEQPIRSYTKLIDGVHKIFLRKQLAWQGSHAQYLKEPYIVKEPNLK